MSDKVSNHMVRYFVNVNLICSFSDSIMCQGYDPNQTEVNKMAKMEITEIQNRITTFLESGNAPAWFAPAYEDNVSSLAEALMTETQFSTAVVGLCKSLRNLNPLSQRVRATMSPEMVTRTAEYEIFFTGVAELFDAIPEGENLYSAKKSDARPAGEYADGKDLVSVMRTKVINAAKAYDKSQRTVATKGDN